MHQCDRRYFMHIYMVNRVAPKRVKACLLMMISYKEMAYITRYLTLIIFTLFQSSWILLWWWCNALLTPALPRSQLVNPRVLEYHLDSTQASQAGFRREYLQSFLNNMLGVPSSTRARFNIFHETPIMVLRGWKLVVLHLFLHIFSLHGSRDI